MAIEKKSTEKTTRRSTVLKQYETPTQRLSQAITANYGAWLLALGAALIFLPQLMEVWLLAYGVVAMYRRRDAYPELATNILLREQDDKSPLVSTGMELTTRLPIWFSDSMIRQHVLVMGTTGAGKTELLLYLAAQALAFGSGFLFVDGKADVKTWFRLYSIAKRLGMEESLRLLNFGTNMKQVRGKKLLKYFLSNSINIFSLGDARSLKEMLSSLMAESGGDNAMWKGRAETMLGAMLICLTELRDMGALVLSSETIIDYMPLPKLQELLNDERLSEFARIEMRRYFESIPGYGAPGPQAQAEVNKQHGFLVMQFTEIMGLLNNAYGHITAFSRGEFNLYDIIVNRRAAYVMLPGMEMGGQSIKNLGKIVISQIRQALAKTLAGGVDGSAAELLNSRPTYSETPFLCILDEYGSYAIEGFGEVAAQARSLGFSVIFAAQDFASLQKADAKGHEALRVWANTNIKIVMKTEDSKETLPLIMDRLKKGYMLELGGTERNPNGSGIFGSGDDRLRAEMRFYELERFDPLDIFDFENGKHMVITGSRFHIVQGPFMHNKIGAWQDAEEAAPPRLVPMVAPSYDDIRRKVEKYKRKLESMSGREDTHRVTIPAIPETALYASVLGELAAYEPDDYARQALCLINKYMHAHMLGSMRQVADALNVDNNDPRLRSPLSKLREDSVDDTLATLERAQFRQPLNDPDMLPDDESVGVDDRYTVDYQSEGENYPEDVNDKMPPLSREEVVQGAISIVRPTDVISSRLSRLLGREDDDEDDGDVGDAALPGDRSQATHADTAAD